MGAPSELTQNASGDWRLDLLRSEPVKRVQLDCTGDVLDTLFFSNDDMPFNNPEAAISSALSSYWIILGHAARIFLPEEWRLLFEEFSPFYDGNNIHITAAEVAAGIEDDYPGSDWNAEVLAFKALMPKVAGLSGADFAAVKDILRLLRNLSSDDPFFTMSRKLPSLEQHGAVRRQQSADLSKRI